MQKNKRRYIFKRITAFAALAAMLCGQSVFADVLGTHTGHTSEEFAQGTTYITNTFQSDQEGVGQQAEHYFSYVPNNDVRPIVSNGASIYGKRTLAQANQLIESQGKHTAMGMNADFFSFQTGVPMSNTIIEGRVSSKDSSWKPGIGFNADGTAFISQLAINTSISNGTSAIDVECINKYRQPYSLYLYTPEYGDVTHASGWGLDIVFNTVSGDITLNSAITAVVESIDYHDGSVPIPEGKLVLSVDANADQSLLDRMGIFAVGQTVTISTSEATGDARWLTAEYGLGCLGGSLLTNGQLDFVDEGAAPRSAVGIKGDGTVIFYTIDGRQPGYSYGIRKETLARRLLELGCVDAVNLDGGGSTTLGGVFPGTTDFTILNAPSEGTLRSCANFIFLQKMNPRTGDPSILYMDPYGEYILSGSTTQVSVIKAVDSSYGPAEIPSAINYLIEKDTPEGGSQVDAEGNVRVYGNGDVYVAASSGNAYGSTLLHSVTTPDAIQIINANTGQQVYNLTLAPGENITLWASAFLNGIKLTAQNSAFDWDVISDDETIGNIDGEGFFSASQVAAGSTGKIVANAGGTRYEIPVTISGSASNDPDDNIPAAFPSIQGRVDDTSFTASISSPNGTIVEDGIRLTIDGILSNDFTYEGNTIRYLFDEQFNETPHRIGLYVTDTSGASAMTHYDAGGNLVAENPFADTIGHWAEKPILFLHNKGVVNGNGSDEGITGFAPDSPMTRAQFAVMLANYLKVDLTAYQNVALPFLDNANIPFWAENQIKAIYSMGIMKGQLADGGNIFNPDANIKRVEYAISIYRLLPEGLAPAEIQATDRSDVPWWAEKEMQIAVGQGILSGYPDGTIRPNQSVTRAEAAKILYTIF